MAHMLIASTASIRAPLGIHSGMGSPAKTASQGAAPFVPPTRSLPVLREAAQKCRGGDLYRNTTQAVFGEGGSRGRARIMMIGEQPGDREDREGHPFVGPAGKLLDRCLAIAGIDRKDLYVTNAVKHFKWEPRGKLRIHKKPNAREIAACRPWLMAELESVKPELVVCLGATAAQGILGADFRVTRSHGQLQHVQGWPPILATAHPASILRARSDEDRPRQAAEFVEDLRVVRGQMRRAA